MASEPYSTANAAEIDRLALAVATDPASKAFIPLAEEYGKAGMWAEAAVALEAGLKNYPNFVTALVALGRVYDRLNQPVKAKTVLEEAVKLSPENLRAHRTLAKIYSAEGANEAALQSCAMILTVNPQDQEALTLRTTLGMINTPSQTTDLNRTSELLTVHPAIESTQVPLAKLPMTLPKQSLPTTIDAPIQEARAREDSANVVPPARTATQIRRLEQWLAAIRVRRRPPTSAMATPEKSIV